MDKVFVKKAVCMPCYLFSYFKMNPNATISENTRRNMIYKQLFISGVRGENNHDGITISAIFWAPR